MIFLYLDEETVVPSCWRLLSDFELPSLVHCTRVTLSLSSESFFCMFVPLFCTCNYEAAVIDLWERDLSSVKEPVGYF